MTSFLFIFWPHSVPMDLHLQFSNKKRKATSQWILFHERNQDGLHFLECYKKSVAFAAIASTSKTSEFSSFIHHTLNLSRSSEHWFRSLNQISICKHLSVQVMCLEFCCCKWFFWKKILKIPWLDAETSWKAWNAKIFSRMIDRWLKKNLK